MSAQKEKILTSQLSIGMYVSKLDRPWIETPFAFQGFYIRTKGEISDIQKFCKYVYITVEAINNFGNQNHAINAPSPLLVDKKQEPSTNNKSTKKYTSESDLKKIDLDIGRYESQTKQFSKELNNAKIIFEDLSHSLQQLSFNIRVGNKINFKETKAQTKKIVGSVIKNPNTMVWLSQLKSKGDYTYNHSLRSSVLAIVFGRYLGLDEEQLTTLANGVLLSDIGKTKIPRALLEATHELSAEEKETVLNHVNLGVEMLAQDENIDHDVLVIVETHHERINGSGYPFGLVGDEIPFLGQIAGLVDVFDAITNKKSYGRHLTSAKAMDWLYSKKDELFSSELIDSFIQAIGLYPAGSIVELTDNSVAVVVSHNNDKRLRPNVILLKDHNQQKVISKKTIDLSKRAFLSKVDRPMVKKAILLDDLNFSKQDLIETINNTSGKMSLFG